MLRSVGVSDESLKKLRDLGALETASDDKGQHLQPTETITFKVDSGAAVTVIKRRACRRYKLLPNRTSMRGGGYRTATGTFVRDLGSKVIVGRCGGARGAVTKGIRPHVADVSQNLLAVVDMINNDQIVTFSKERSFARNTKTGEEIDFVLRDGTFELEMDVFSPQDAEKILEQRSFQGQGVSP